MSVSIGCIDYRDGKVFIAKRQNKGDMANRWEFPGGKLDEGEDFTAAIKREMREEFGVEVEVGQEITSTTFKHKGKDCFLHVFEVKFQHDGMEKPFVLTEHTDYKWVSFAEIPQLSFVDSDLSVYPAIVKYFEK